MIDMDAPRSIKRWIPLTAEYSAVLSTFLIEEEYRCIALSERLRSWLERGGISGRFRGLDGSKPWIHCGEIPSAAAIVSEGSGFVDGVALLRPDGTGFCILPESAEGVRGFASIVRAAGTLSSLTGMGEDLERIAVALGVSPLEARSYLLMRFNANASRGLPFFGLSQGANLSPGNQEIEVRRATVRDFSSLCSLHEAYEREEIGSRQLLFAASLPERIMRILGKQIAVVATIKGKIVGKANTNARGLRSDQIGGVYVIPELRRRGVGALMVGSLTSLLAASGRGICLYVRPENEGACRLYAALGFIQAGTYGSCSFPMRQDRARKRD